MAASSSTFLLRKQLFGALRISRAKGKTLRHFRRFWADVLFRDSTVTNVNTANSTRQSRQVGRRFAQFYAVNIDFEAMALSNFETNNLCRRWCMVGASNAGTDCQTRNMNSHGHGQRPRNVFFFSQRNPAQCVNEGACML